MNMDSGLIIMTDDDEDICHYYSIDCSHIQTKNLKS